MEGDYIRILFSLLNQPVFSLLLRLLISCSSSEEDGTLWEKDHKYWKDGLSVKGNYKDGKKDGLWEYYYFYGELQEKYYYKNGKKDGLWEYFNADGSLKKTETFRDGELVE